MKKVTFDTNEKIYTLHVWTYAYKQARKSDWEQLTRDRARFERRIQKCGEILVPMLQTKLEVINRNKKTIF